MKWFWSLFGATTLAIDPHKRPVPPRPGGLSCPRNAPNLAVNWRRATPPAPPTIAGQPPPAPSATTVKRRPVTGADRRSGQTLDGAPGGHRSTTLARTTMTRQPSHQRQATTRSTPNRSPPPSPETDRSGSSQAQRRPATPSSNLPTTDIRPSKATPRLGRNSRSSPSAAIEGKPGPGIPRPTRQAGAHAPSVSPSTADPPYRPGPPAAATTTAAGGDAIHESQASTELRPEANCTPSSMACPPGSSRAKVSTATAAKPTAVPRTLNPHQNAKCHNHRRKASSSARTIKRNLA
jgi:hypothetical protein